MTETEALNDAYTERAQLVALLAAVYPSHIGPASDEPGWWIVQLQLPTGQAGWHIAQTDLHLFAHVETTTSDHPEWDGHTTAEKYQRIRDLVTAIDNGTQPRIGARPDDGFEVGKYYITENSAFVFQCNQLTSDGIALGRELRVDGRPSADSHYVYIGPGVRDLWREIDETEVHAAHGEHGWIHRPKTRPSAAS